ncbi:MAG: globin [Phycisphaerales bacterium]
MTQFGEDRVYEQIGEDGFDRLTVSFYRRVESDDILGPMYERARTEADESDLEDARLRLRDFLVQRFGGPTRYSEARGHPRLRMRHMPFAIDEAARDRWLALMDESLVEANIPDPSRSVLQAVFAHVADFMRNR